MVRRIPGRAPFELSQPSWTAADVARVIRRDFPEADVAAAEAVVLEYGREDHEPEPDRVRLAALKLAAGNIEKLRGHITVAKADFRDVILAAEFPKRAKVWVGIDRMPPEKQEKIRDDDRKQYETWLKRD